MNACVQERAPVRKSEPSSSPSSSLSWSRWSGKSTWRKLGGIYLFVFHEPPKQVMFASQKKMLSGLAVGRDRPHLASGGGDCQLGAAGVKGNLKICRQHQTSGRLPVLAHAMNMKTETEQLAIRLSNQVEQYAVSTRHRATEAKAATLFLAAASRTSRQAERPSSPFTGSSQRVRGPPAQRRAPKAPSSPPGAASWPPPGRPP